MRNPRQAWRAWGQGGARRVPGSSGSAPRLSGAGLSSSLPSVSYRERSGLNLDLPVRNNLTVGRHLNSVVAWSLGLLLVGLHLAPLGHGEDWIPGLPAELGFRLGWMVLALFYLLWFCRHIWKAEGGEE